MELACLHDRPGNTPGVSFLTKLIDDISQSFFLVSVPHILGTDGGILVQPHIELFTLPERKTAFGLFKVEAGNAQVKENQIQILLPIFREEIIKPDIPGGKTFTKGFHSLDRFLLDLTVTIQPCYFQVWVFGEEEERMSAFPTGAVDHLRRPIIRWYQVLEDFLGHYRVVNVLHQKSSLIISLSDCAASRNSSMLACRYCS